MTNYYELLAESEPKVEEKRFHKHKASRGREFDRKSNRLATRLGDKKEMVEKGTWGNEQKAQLESVADEVVEEPAVVVVEDTVQYKSLEEYLKEKKPLEPIASRPIDVQDEKWKKLIPVQRKDDVFVAPKVCFICF
jgi:hypothetical protein